MRAIIKTEVKDFFIRGEIPYAAWKKLLHNGGRPDEIKHPANLSESIDVNHFIILPEYLSIVLDESFLTLFVLQ